MTANKEYEKQNLETALLEFAAINKKYSKFYQCRFMEGKTLYFLERFNEAALVFADLLEEKPEFSQAAVWMAKTFTISGAWVEAEEALLKQLSYDPADPRILLDLSNIKAKQRETAVSFEYLQRAKIFSQEFVYVYINLAKFYYQNDMTNAALAELNTALKLLDKDNPLVFAIENLIKEMQSHD